MVSKGSKRRKLVKQVYEPPLDDEDPPKHWTFTSQIKEGRLEIKWGRPLIQTLEPAREKKGIFSFFGGKGGGEGLAKLLSQQRGKR